MEEILLLTDIVTICIYATIFLMLFLIGFVFRSRILYSNARETLSEEVSSNAWYPILNIITMGETVQCNYIIALVASVMFILATPTSLLFLITKVLSSKICIAMIIFFYLLYSTCHTVILKKYMNKFSPETSDLCIIVSGYIPLLKYYIHII